MARGRKTVWLWPRPKSSPRNLASSRFDTPFHDTSHSYHTHIHRKARRQHREQVKRAEGAALTGIKRRLPFS